MELLAKATKLSVALNRKTYVLRKIDTARFMRYMDAVDETTYHPVRTAHTATKPTHQPPAKAAEVINYVAIAAGDLQPRDIVEYEGAHAVVLSVSAKTRNVQLIDNVHTIAGAYHRTKVNVPEKNLIAAGVMWLDTLGARADFVGANDETAVFVKIPHSKVVKGFKCDTSKFANLCK